MKHAQRLKIRLRLAYYKVITNQTNLPLTRLPSPESPSRSLPDPKYDAFLYQPTTPSLLQAQSQTTPHVFTRPYIPSLRNTNTPMQHHNQHPINNKLVYTLYNPPSSTASTISIKTPQSSASSIYHDSALTSASSFLTPVKQQHYPFHLGGYDIDEGSYSNMSPDIYASAKRILPETPAGGSLKTRGSMGVAKSLLQLGSFS